MMNNNSVVQWPRKDSGKRILIVNTDESREQILAQGGTAAWTVIPTKVSQCEYVVCCHRTAGPKKYAAFLIGKISGLQPLPGTGKKANQNRYLIKFSEYADIDVPNAWPGHHRNTVRYGTAWDAVVPPSWSPIEPPTAEGLSELNRQVACGKFGIPPELDPGPRTINEVKEALARTYGIPVENISITIRG